MLPSALLCRLCPGRRGGISGVALQHPLFCSSLECLAGAVGITRLSQGLPAGDRNQKG